MSQLFNRFLALTGIFPPVIIGFAILSVTTVQGRNLSVNLKGSNGLFVVAENGGGGAVNVDRAQARQWETFTLIDINNGELMNNDQVNIKTVNGRFFAALEGGGGDLVADRTVPLEWERFTVVILRPAGATALPLVSGRVIALRTHNGRFLTVENNVLTARAMDASGAAAQFTVGGVKAPIPDTLSGPFTAPQTVFLFPMGVDRGRPQSNVATICRNFGGARFPTCYGGHDGTDYAFVPGFPGMNMGSINVVAAAPGRVAIIDDGHADRCYFRPSIGSTPSSPSSSYIFCPGNPSLSANFVGIVQDDGLIAYYFHLKRSSIQVQEGDRVECGQLLGKVGSSGISSAPHLHFQLMRITSPATFPSTAADVDNLRDTFNGGSRTGVQVVDPYGPPPLWAILVGLVPQKFCSHPSTNGDLGQVCGDFDGCAAGLSCQNGRCRVTNVPPGGACNDNNLCGPGLTCQAGTCRVLSVGPGGSCDSNNPCGPNLTCQNGRCKPPCTCPATCFTDASGSCKKDVPALVREDCSTVMGACIGPCFRDANNACKKEVWGQRREDCALVCPP